MSRVIALLIVVVMSSSGCASTSELRAFTTDACSLFPEGDAKDPQRWAECCTQHDQPYWRGGTAEQRRIADAALRSCVQERTGRNVLASLMYRGVRLGGTPYLPTPFRWGYGWEQGWISGRGYQALTPSEQNDADEKLRAYVLKSAAESH